MSYKYKRKSPTPEERRKEIEELTAPIPEKVAAVKDSDSFKEVCINISKHHNYSVNNILLAMSQRDDISFINSYGTWKNTYHRQVKKGEHGEKILVPVQRRTEIDSPVLDPETKKQKLDDEGNPLTEKKEVQYLSYVIGTVFDISQTEQIPNMSVVRLSYVDDLKGDVKGFDKLMTAIQEACPVPIRMVDHLEGMEKGYFSLSENEVVIRTDVDALQQVKTAIHESCHARNHSNFDGIGVVDKNGNYIDEHDREVQAEGTAFTVCSYLQNHGFPELDVSSYSIPYIFSWSQEGNTERIKSNLDAIRTESNEIIESIEGSLQRMEMTEEKTLTASELTEKLTDFYKEAYPEKFKSELYQGAVQDKIASDVRHNRLDSVKQNLSKLASEESNKNHEKAEKLLKNVEKYQSDYVEEKQELKQTRSMKL